jgi:uncharacterized protein YoxC
MSSNSSASSYASAASAVMVATEATYATYIKEIMANMPDDLDSKKDIDNFYKAAIKDIKGKIKDANKAAKTATKAAKKKGKKASDEDDVEKVKKPPSAYQIFLKENRASVKEENPELTGKECTELLRTMWSKHKEDKA